jgi:LuxR family transcriptional regulator, maltose regulon positive regulatory protein
MAGAGEYRPALAWAQSSGLSVDDDLSLAREHEYVALARVLIAIGEHSQANKLLDRLLSAAESAGRVWIQIELIALQALAHQAGGQRTAALNRLTHALHIAAPQGYVRSFVDAGTALVPLLREAHKNTSAPAYVDRLLAAFSSSAIGDEQHPPQNSQLKTQNGLVEPPSERELEVLRLVAAGLSNQAIAERLVVTLSTVKKHINHLYGKLGVRTRTQALARARELNLL